MPEDTDPKDLASNETNCEIAGVVDYCKNFDGYMTTTTIDQEGCEERCAAYLIPNDMLSKDELATRIKSGYFDENGDICFMRDQHIHYCRKHLGTLGGAYMSQCSAYLYFVHFYIRKPWLYYYVLNSLDLLNAEAIDCYPQAINSIEACRCALGGYAGSHLEVSLPFFPSCFLSIPTPWSPMPL